MTSPDAPEFGPSGYLPERASQRARKIVLRAPLGVQWIVASAAFGIVVLVTGVLFLARSGAPEAPYLAVADLAEIDGARLVADHDVLLVTAGGPIAAFADADRLELSYCPANRRLEGSDGRVWTLTGRGLGGDSLEQHPVVVHAGTVYLDPTRRVAGPRPAEAAEAPACH